MDWAEFWAIFFSSSSGRPVGIENIVLSAGKVGMTTHFAVKTFAN
jgi:hypothetical protein